VGYVVPVAGVELSVGGLLEFVAGVLPSFMVPSVVVVVDGLPLTPSGKVDRAALPVPELGSGLVAPVGEAEELLAAVWCEVLGLAGVGADDNFFELGGDSILAMQLCWRAGAALDRRVPVDVVFREPTLAALAAAILELPSREGPSPDAAPTIAPVLLPSQRGLWALEMAQPERGAGFEMVGGVWLRGPVDAERLRRSVELVTRRHRMLRWCYPAVRGLPFPRECEQPVPVELEVLAGGIAEAWWRLGRLSRERVDLANGPLFRAWVWDVGEGCVVGLMTHHLVFDAWSAEVFAAEVVASHAALTAGTEPELPEVDDDLARVVTGQLEHEASRAFRAELGWWVDRLRGAAPVTVPGDRPAAGPRTGARWSGGLAAGLVARTRDLAKARSASPVVPFLAAFVAWLAEVSGESDVVVGMPVSGRARPEAAGLVGCFVNTLPLRWRLDPEVTFEDLLEQTRRVLTDGLARQETPLHRIVEACRADGDGGPTRDLPVLFDWHERPGSLALPGVTVGWLDVAPARVSADLVFGLHPHGDELRMVTEYAADRYRAETVAMFAEQYEVLLGRAVDAPGTPIRSVAGAT